MDSENPNPIVAMAQRIRARRDLESAIDAAPAETGALTAANAEEALEAFGQALQRGLKLLNAILGKDGVTYVRLDGSVGILANGAGLAMATVDLVVLAGGRPANFCDLGGGGRAEGVVDALDVITRDPQLRSIFFNVFGGLTRCDEVARGILTALERSEIAVPLVVRLDGTNAEEGRRILANAQLAQLHVEPTMLDAARRAVELAR